MKKAIYYAGLGGGVEPMLYEIFNYFGYDLIQEDYDYYAEWHSDKGANLMMREFEKAKDADLIFGISFGGYVGFHVAKATGIPCILINPALDRAKTRTGIYDFIMDYVDKSPEFEIYIATQDEVVLPRYTINYLKRNKNKVSLMMVEDMTHGSSYEHIVKFLYESKFVDKIQDETV
jgi:alpha/beta superfamily hydrolase